MSAGYLPKLATARERERLKELAYLWLENHLPNATREQIYDIEKALFPGSKTLPVDR